MNLAVLDSDWFLRLLEKTGKTPQARLTAAFDVLADWLEAPNVLASVQANTTETSSNKALQNYLHLQAKLAGAQQPEMLAQQVHLMLTSSLQQALAEPNKLIFSHAKQAASALVQAQTKSEFTLQKTTAFGIAASVLVLFIGGGLWLQNNLMSPPQTVLAEHSKLFQPALAAMSNEANPSDTAAMFASIEQMRKGSCQFIEALQIPDKHKAIYLENVIGGIAPTNAHDQAIALGYMQKIRCNYTPMLMANSK